MCQHRNSSIIILNSLIAANPCWQNITKFIHSFKPGGGGGPFFPRYECPGGIFVPIGTNVRGGHFSRGTVTPPTPVLVQYVLQF